MDFGDGKKGLTPGGIVLRLLQQPKNPGDRGKLRHPKCKIPADGAPNFPDQIGALGLNFRSDFLNLCSGFSA